MKTTKIFRNDFTENNNTLNDINGLIDNNDIPNLIKYLKYHNIKPKFFNNNNNIINDLINDDLFKKDWFFYLERIKNQSKLINKIKFLKCIFNTYKFNNGFILNLLIHYKNKDLTYSKLKCLLSKENKKIIITDNMYECAIKSNNYVAIKILFENEIFINKNIALKKILKYNILLNSVETEDLNFVKRILSYKDFNFRNLRYREILITAIINDETINSSQYKIAKLLIKSLLKPPYSSGIYKNSVLNIAIEIGNFYLIKYLIENEDFKYTKEEINSKDLKGHYPIIEAISNKNFKIFNYLLEKGADYNTINNYGVPLLFLALHLNDIEYIISLVNDKTHNKIDVNILDNNGYTPLIISYINKYMDIFNYLIEYSDINQKDKYGHSILYYVIKNKDNANAKGLIDIGAKIDEDILDIAIKKSEIDIILEYDDIPLNKYKGENDESFLISVILHNKYISSNKIEKLIIKGCDINAKDKEGNTPLIYAVKQKDKSIIKLLIKYGAIKSMKNVNGKKAIDFSSCEYYCHSSNTCSCGYREIWNLLTD